MCGTGIILTGEIWLVLDDSEVLCKAGDVIVQVRPVLEACAD